jgi:CRISPR/Cas system-associated exonuclease Cas4 (RecB family)
MVSTECDTLYYRGGIEWPGSEQPVVIDWKSGSSKSGDDRQLWLYWYGLVMMGVIPEDCVFEAYFGYLDHKEIVQTTLVYPGHEAMGYFIDEMESRRRGKTYMPVPSWKCKYCPVYRACPVFEDQHDALSWPTLLGLMDSLEFREE